MKKKLSVLMLLAALFVPIMSPLSVSTVGAVDLFDPICSGANDTNTNAQNTDVCKDKAAAGTSPANPVIHILSVTITIISFIIGIVSVITIIISGFRIIESRGDSQKVATARSAIIYALIGVVIAMVAASIVGLVLNKL